ncbi:MAG: ABC transporter ATP-binding protein [Candidatus Hodarchaeota archaeon]
MKDVRKEYELGSFLIIALDDVNLSIEKNQFVTIQGASGAGKTTLLNIIGSLDKPTKGEVLVDNINIGVMNEDALASWRTINLGFIFQSFNLISTLTAWENVAFPSVFWNNETQMIEQRVTELLDMVNLSDRGDHLPHQLSAGEQQRVAIARALMNDPPLIVADEPTANLDATTAGLIIEIFVKIKKMEEKSIIVATHDDRLLNLSDIKLTMDAGKIIEN